VGRALGIMMSHRTANPDLILAETSDRGEQYPHIREGIGKKRRRHPATLVPDAHHTPAP